MLDEGTHDMDAHFDSGLTVENVGGLDGAVLREGVGQIFYVLTALQGRILRP
jgi:hypothetical protein